MNGQGRLPREVHTSVWRRRSQEVKEGEKRVSGSWNSMRKAQGGGRMSVRRLKYPDVTVGGEAGSGEDQSVCG